MRRLPPLEFEDILARSVLRESDHWHVLPGGIYGRLFAHGRLDLAATGPAEYAAEAVEALARSYRVAEPYLEERAFRQLMDRQRVPSAAVDAWLRGARVTEDGVYLAWERPR